MDDAGALSTLRDQPALGAVAEPLSKAVRGLYEAASRAGLQAKNFLHGVWPRRQSLTENEIRVVIS